MRKNITTLAEETRKNRLRMHDLVEQGYPEYHALAKVFPGDSNRRRQLKIWQQNGLWPVPFDELKGGGKPERAVESVQIDEPSEKQSVRGPKAPEAMGRGEIEELVTEIVNRELARLFNNVVVSPIPKTGKTGKRAIKKAFSLPADLWEEVERLFPGEIMSNVITAALRLYVNGKKELNELKEAR
jgi:hypothetical protein